MPLSFKPGDESGVPSLERGGVDISTYVSLKKKSKVVLLHVGNKIVFRRVLWRRASGKNATVFLSRAMPCMSCFELCSLMGMKRTIGVGRHTGVIPEALGLEP